MYGEPLALVRFFEKRQTRNKLRVESSVVDFAFHQPQPYLWTKLEQRGDAKVSGRSGHTLTATAAGLVLFGGVDGRLDCNENPAPNNDVYLLNINRTTATWRELRIPLAQRPPPRAMHSCTALSSNLLFFFGGCSSASPFVCKNDTWTLDVSTQTFKRIVCKGEETEVRVKRDFSTPGMHSTHMKPLLKRHLSSSETTLHFPFLLVQVATERTQTSLPAS
ncbi:putative kelch repeat protein [Toxoplasma gondii RUB]|uniref:Putative kelch repeat protein n=1 Tax=Toxoplasma gondii RUB TaxID=935652 RepID=A0A086M8Z2_TOXGO|nr:putative kelch repeat protein [Toxoplasma gondii RUB]